jgi:hypothetical protein
LLKQRALAVAKGCPFVETRVALLSKLYTKPSISKTTTTARGHEAVAHGEATRSSRSLELSFKGIVAARPEPKGRSPVALVLPEQLHPDLHTAAVAVVEKAPEGLRQQLLDELAGRLATSINPLDNPVGWLAKLLVRAQAGQAIFTRAPLVAAARAAKEKNERAVADAVEAASPVSTPHPSAAPSSQSAFVAQTIEALRKRHGLQAKKGRKQ